VIYTLTATNSTIFNIPLAALTIYTSGTASCAVAISGSGNPTLYITFSSCNGNGTVDFSIASGVAQSSSGNSSPQASAPFTLESSLPSVVIGSPSTTSVTSSSTNVTFTVSASDNDSFNLPSVTLNTTGSASCTASVSGTGTSSRTVTLSLCVGIGTVGFTAPSGAAQTRIGGQSNAQTSGTVSVNNNTAFVSIGTPSASTVNSGSAGVTFPVTAGINTAFTLPSVTLNTTSTASCTSGITGSGITSRTVTLSSCTGTGTVSFTVLAGAATNASSSSIAQTSTAITVSNAAQLVFSTQPRAPTVNGAAFATQPIVSVEDALGNLYGGTSYQITLVAYQDPTCSTPAAGTFSVTTSPVSSTFGSASFSGATYTGTAGGTIYLKASATGLTSACSTAIRLPQFALVASGPSVYQCSVNTAPGPSLGNLGSCTNTNASTWQPSGISVATLGGNSYAFVIDQNAHGINKCSINATTGVLSSCADNSGPGYYPYLTAFTTVGGNHYIYVSETNGQIYKCSVSNTGTFSSCSVTNGGISFQGIPSAIAFGTYDSILYAYVIDQGETLFRCSVLTAAGSTQGNLSSCSAIVLSGGSPEPTGIALGFFGSTHYAYVYDGGNKIYRCTIDASGDANNGGFTTCASTVEATGGGQISLQTVGGSTYAYLSDGTQHDGLWQCPINSSTGAVGSCRQNFGVTSSALSASGAAMLSVSGTIYAYLADSFGSNLFQCPVDASGTGTNGNLQTCNVTGQIPNFGTVANVLMANAGSNLYAYVLSESTPELSGRTNTGTIFQCLVDQNTGNLSNCVSNWSYTNPQTLAFSGTSPVVADSGNTEVFSINASTGAFTYTTEYSYSITNSSATSAEYQSFGSNPEVYLTDGSSVYLCEDTSSVWGCSTVTTNITSWLPKDLHFATISGTTYAYVADSSGNIYQCSVNTSNGAIGTCTATNGGAITWSPLNILFNTLGGTTLAYVTDGSSVYQCSVSSTGVLSSCTPYNGGASLTPTGIAFQP